MRLFQGAQPMPRFRFLSSVCMGSSSRSASSAPLRSLNFLLPYLSSFERGDGRSILHFFRSWVVERAHGWFDTWFSNREQVEHVGMKRFPETENAHLFTLLQSWAQKQFLQGVSGFVDVLTPPLTLDRVVQSWCPFNGWTSTLVHLFWGIMKLGTWSDDCRTGGEVQNLVSEIPNFWRSTV